MNGFGRFFASASSFHTDASGTLLLNLVSDEPERLSHPFGERLVFMGCGYSHTSMEIPVNTQGESYGVSGVSSGIRCI